MRLALASDLHLEFGDCDITNAGQAQVLILGGDIMVAQDLLSTGSRRHMLEKFLVHVSNQFEHVVMIMGNHEHYRGDFGKTQTIMQDALDRLAISNCYLLEKQHKEIQGWLFLGGTLWTDFNRGDPNTMWYAVRVMGDYHGIKNSVTGQLNNDWKFRPEHAYQDHKAMVTWLRAQLAQRRSSGNHSRRVIVVGHHAPSSLSVAQRFLHDHNMNCCFYSDLSELILDCPEIVLWTHGHTHDAFDYEIGHTRIACNPRGYIGHEPQADSWQLKYIDLAD